MRKGIRRISSRKRRKLFDLQMALHHLLREGTLPFHGYSRFAQEEEFPLGQECYAGFLGHEAILNQPVWFSEERMPWRF